MGLFSSIISTAGALFGGNKTKRHQATEARKAEEARLKAEELRLQNARAIQEKNEAKGVTKYIPYALGIFALIGSLFIALKGKKRR